MTTKSIPPSVLALLSQQWPAPGFQDNGHRPGPARYLFRPDDGPGRVHGGLRHSQVRALVADGVLSNDWRGIGDAIAITADQRQALSDFLAAVHDAWDRLQERTDMARPASDLRRVG